MGQGETVESSKDAPHDIEQRKKAMPMKNTEKRTGTDLFMDELHQTGSFSTYMYTCKNSGTS